jgi:ABC-type multidrug transport system ATPase subunit
MRIHLQSVSKRYGKVHALDKVSLTIEPGNIVSILGPNGAGKTTLLRCLGAIVVQSTGHIYFDGERFTRGNLPLRRRLAFLPDFPIAFPHYSVLRHIGMVLRLYERDTAAAEGRVIELLRAFDLLPLVDNPVGELSRGQFYKVALTAVLAAQPEVLLIDEPFASGMDPNGITVFKREAREAARKGQTVIYSTQILDVAEKLSDWICVMERGQVKHYGPLDELTHAESGKGGVLEQLFQQLRETLE